MKAGRPITHHNKIGILVILLSFLSCAFHAAENESYISKIEIDVEGVQRENKAFTIRNKTDGNADWRWEIIDADNGKVIETSREQNPRISLPIGRYDVKVSATGKNVLIRHFRRCITVLPKVFSERDADEVIDLSEIKDSSYIRDFGSRKRPGYKILIKGKFNGRVRFTGLRGTKKNPVHIINQGAVEITATNDASPYAWQFSDNNQYVLLDGNADPSVRYGFTITGHPSKSGQVLFIAGVFNRGFEVCGVRLVGRQGVTNGAAAIQVQTAYTKECNADNWDFEYFRIHHCKIEKASSEGMYIGYFTDEKRDTGHTPYRMGTVQVYRDSLLQCGWDGIQVASADEFEIHDNYIDGASLAGKRSHSSFVSWNSGNKQGWCYRNTFRNCAHGASIMFGESGKEAYVYSNLLIEGTYPSNITAPAFIFSKLNNASQDVGLYIFHNTIHTSKIPVKVDYKNEKKTNGMPVVFAGNALLLNRLNLKTYPEIAMGSNLSDSSAWTIKNIWRSYDQKEELKWDSVSYVPLSDSPLVNVNFNLKKHFNAIKGGFYDRDGYPLFHEEHGYTAGCFSAHQITVDQPMNDDGVPKN